MKTNCFVFLFTSLKKEKKIVFDCIEMLLENKFSKKRKTNIFRIKPC